MIRIVPKEESKFHDEFQRLVYNFANKHNIRWASVLDSKSIEEGINGIAATLWFMKTNITPEMSKTELKNMKELQELVEKDSQKKDKSFSFHSKVVTKQCKRK